MGAPAVDWFEALWAGCFWMIGRRQQQGRLGLWEARGRKVGRAMEMQPSRASEERLVSPEGSEWRAGWTNWV